MTTRDVTRSDDCGPVACLTARARRADLASLIRALTCGNVTIGTTGAGWTGSDPTRSLDHSSRPAVPAGAWEIDR
jgi:hypothetical protein